MKQDKIEKIAKETFNYDPKDKGVKSLLDYEDDDIQPEDLGKVTKLTLIDLLESRNIIYEQIMAEMVMIREELLHRLEEAKIDAERIGEYSVTKAKRVSFKTSLEEAEVLGAVKKSVDTDQLKKLHNKGIKVPGVQTTIYLSVRRLSQEEAEK